jgi:hypothetical protein
MRDAGIPKPAASASMPMPSYGFTVSAIFEEIPPTKNRSVSPPLAGGFFVSTLEFKKALYAKPFYVQW